MPKRQNQKYRVLTLALLSCASMALAGCSSDNGSSRIALPGMTQFFKSENQQFLNLKETTDSQDINRWWERLNDPFIDSYLDSLLKQNPDLVAAGQRVIQAQESLNIQRGSFMPSVSAQADASRSFTGVTGRRVYTTSYTPELAASWEIDLFGKIRRSVESARSTFEATVYDEQALTQSLIASMVNRRIGIAVNKALLDIVKDNVENREKTLTLVQNRYDLGANGVSMADVYAAQESVTSARADMQTANLALAGEVYALDVLLGQSPGTSNFLLDDSNPFPLLTPPLELPPLLPADILDRRPDLRASQLRIAAANADIGVAIADLYPTAVLGGSIGFSSDSFSDLLTADRLAGSLLASITSRLFEGGSLRANIRLKQAQARELAAIYAGDILDALNDVETALKAEEELSIQLQHLQESEESIAAAETIAQDRYARGLITLQELLDIQQRHYAVQQSLLNAQQQKWESRIALYLALGGDWFDVTPPPAIQEESGAPQIIPVTQEVTGEHNTEEEVDL